MLRIPANAIQWRRLGAPILPDQLVTAAGVSETFSPGTPDALMVQILKQQGQQLPPDLAAKMAAVTPSGQAVSTQTAAPVVLTSTIGIAPGVWKCLMSDGSSHYCDAHGNPISYTPPPPTPAVTPAAASLPTSAVSPSVAPAPALPIVYAIGAGGGKNINVRSDGSWVLVDSSNNPVPMSSLSPLDIQNVMGGIKSTYNIMSPAVQTAMLNFASSVGQSAVQTPAPAPVGSPVAAVTPSGQPISSTSGTPAPAAVPASGFDLSSIMSWIQGSSFTLGSFAVPNWMLLAGGAALLLLDGGGGSRRR